MKAFTFITLILSLVVFSFSAKDDPKNKPVNITPTSGYIPPDSKLMNSNSISTYYINNASFNRQPSSGNAGFEWPKGSVKYARYASGIWLGCVSGNDTLTAVAEFSYDFVPGYVDNAGFPQNDSTYRIYNIYKNNFTDYDYQHWPVQQGAYVSADNKPYMIGDQTMFMVYTEAFPHASGSTSIRSLKAQIIQTNWVYNVPSSGLQYPENPLTNTIFMEYRIINRSNEQWNNMWFTIWTDDDVGNVTDDKAGCDSMLNMGYTFNATNYDRDYGYAPPAVGMIFLKGFEKYTGNISDSVTYYQPFGSSNKRTRAGYRDQLMMVYNTYNGASPQPSDPLNNTEVYRVIRGLWRLGDSWINPITHDTTTLPFNGDPVANTGWIMPGEADRRWLICTGPATIPPGDTMTVIAAQIIAKGNSNLNSITQLRRTANVVKNFYLNNMKPIAAINSPVVSSSANVPGKINLTWDGTAEDVSYANPLSGGIHKFQGYNIYQINSYSNHPSEEDTVLIATYDKNDGIKNIFDSTYISGMSGMFYGIVQKGSDNGISRYITIERDTISRKNFINGTEYKFAVTAYYYDSTGSLLSLPKVRESGKNNIIKVIPQNFASGTVTDYSTGDSLFTDQKDPGVIPFITDPAKLVNAFYTSVIGGTVSKPTWTLSRINNGTTTILFENDTNFSGQTDNEIADGQMFIHLNIRDSGIVRDPGDPRAVYLKNNSLQQAWEYYPKGREWFTAPDTIAILTAKVITNRQFQSRSLGMSFPTTGTFRNNVSRVKATKNFFTPVTEGRPILTGGPLRKIKIIFGKNSQAYRYVPIDTNYTSTPYANMVTIPFSVYAADDLDSSAGALRQLNVGFMDSDNDGQWDPDTSKLGNYHFTYIFASTYVESPHPDYTSKDPGRASPTTGFSALDVMYAWLPRVKSVNGISQSWSEGDTLTVWPYRLTKPDFVPGYPIKYSWTVNGTQLNNKEYASAEVQRIKVFPNPYYGFSELEYNDAQEKFIYISHLPMKATIYIYSLDGVPVKKINRDSNDPSSSLEKWDLKNNDGSYVASGMYIVYVDCGEFGVKTLKIAVFQR